MPVAAGANRLDKVLSLPLQGCSSDPKSQQQAGSRKTCPPPHYQVLGEGADAESISMFYMSVYKASAVSLLRE